MSDLALADNHADRRQHARRPVQRRAEMILNDEAPHHLCTILDESDGGVLLEAVDDMDLPEAAVIKFSDNASQLVRRCWMSGVRGGYQFVEIVPARNPLQDELTQDDQQQLAGRVDMVAMNNFVAITRMMLNAFVTTPERLHSMDQIAGLLSELPRTRLAAEAATSQAGMQQLFMIPAELDRR